MNQPMREFSEKRDFIRMQIDSPVDMTLEHDGDTLSGTCLNLSGGGMMIEVNRVIPVGTVVEVTVSSGHGHNPMLKANAVVNRVTAEASETCTLGLEIKALID